MSNFKPAAIVFLLYGSRSGSTLLSSWLDSFDDIGVTVESNFTYNLLNLSRRLKGVGNARALLSKLEQLDSVNAVNRFGNLGVDADEFTDLFSRTEKSFGSFVQCLLFLHFKDQKPSARVWVVKDGDNAFYLNRIFREMPDARFVHIVRDGRAVMNSNFRTDDPYVKGEKCADEPISCARYWKSVIKSVDRFGRIYPEQVHEIRYEDLVSSPEAIVEAVRRFLGLDPGKHANLGGPGYFSKIPEEERKMHGLVTGGVRADRADAWQKELSFTDIRLFEYYAGALLSEKGYQIGRRTRFADAVTSPELLGALAGAYRKKLARYGRELNSIEKLKFKVLRKARKLTD